MNLQKFKNVKLFHSENLKVLKTLKNNSINLTLTSPPYDNLKNYKKTIKFWTFSDFKKIAHELYRITKNNGVVVWVVCVI